MRVVKYVSTAHREAFLNNHDGVYSIVAFMINSFLKHPTVIQPLQFVGLFVIGRLYFLLPKYRPNLEEVLISLFQIFGELGEPEQ